jgi:hypothetical protein
VKQTAAEICFPQAPIFGLLALKRFNPKQILLNQPGWRRSRWHLSATLWRRTTSQGNGRGA